MGPGRNTAKWAIYPPRSPGRCSDLARADRIWGALAPGAPRDSVERVSPPPRVLVVDDSAVARAWLEALVEDAGASPIVCESVDAACGAIDAAGTLDAVVLDWQLEGGDSEPIARRLPDDVPVAFFTSEPNSVREPLRARASVFHKTRDRDAIATWLRRVLGR